ncbi:MAG TPA: glycoside hydrolase family 57 protein [Candidatus Angelobacter sp.]|nr:glycoside hydrolase family 57 protein [Candidatus Angelobacter sp.]
MDTPGIQLLFLWHMHQPYYKDLVTGEYRLPWVRLHALKDYYGMVKLLDEFPAMHQTFNLVPSLIEQLQEYVSGAAHDPFLEAASRPAQEMGLGEKMFVLRYLFQANVDNMIGRYPRYRELWSEFHTRPEDATAAAHRLRDIDITDLQVLSQIAWMDEFFLEDQDIHGLIDKGRNYSLQDQQLVMARQREFLARVLPAYAEAGKRGAIEISTSPFYHPILPLLCDTDIGAVSHHGLPLPGKRFNHPDDARQQIERGLKLHEKVFGMRPRGMWPSEGSVSDQVLGIAHEVGLNWVATDEGVLGRSVGATFHRDGKGNLDAVGADQLYRVYRWKQNSAAMNVVFRDHSLSDLIGFVYSGVPAKDAAQDFIRRVKESASQVAGKGRTAVVPIILDGENAWESYPHSGREFLRRLYDGIQKDPAMEALTISEAIERDKTPRELNSIFPGSWINANFDVWIGAPEDNTAWDYLSAARDFFAENSDKAEPGQRELALAELLIAEGSDWNWWYGPEHHSENDREFDELYRKHLSNVYSALGGAPPDALAQPIAGMRSRLQFTPQTAYIHPQIDGRNIGYFEWLGAATHVADRHSSAMHGKLFLLDTGYAAIDEENLYCRLDFMEPPAEWAEDGTRLVVAIETLPLQGTTGPNTHRVEADISGGSLHGWKFAENGDMDQPQAVGAGLQSLFECRVPLSLLDAVQGSTLRVRFSVWRDRLPLDALPQEGAIEVRMVPEDELSALPYAKP